MPKISVILIIVAGLLGASGVGLAAAAAHVTDSAALRAASEIAMVHAVAVIGLLALSNHAANQKLWLMVSAAMALGAVLFTGTVALGVLADFRPIPALAPIGGSLTILSWIGVAIAGVWEGLAKRP